MRTVSEYEELPHSYEAEASVLGSIIIESSLIHECDLKPVEFYDDRHQLIMNYMYYLKDLPEGKPVDVILIAEHAGKNIEKIGGIEYLMKLSNYVPTTGNFGYYHDIVRKKAKLRNAKLAMTKKVSQADYADDPDEYIADSIQALEDLRTESEGEKPLVRLGEVLKDHEATLSKRKEQDGLTGTKSTSEDLDKLTGGYQKQDLIILAARPSMGKTDFMVSDAIKGQEHALKMGIVGTAAAIFSLEMTADLLAERALCNIGNIDNKKLKSGEMLEEDWERWSIASKHLNDLPIFIDDTPGLTVKQIGRKVEWLKRRYPELTVYIDFLQKVRPGLRNLKKHEGVSYVSENLKLIARKHDIPVIALSAVGRSVEQRQDKRPMMSDLRESGSIESDADIVMFLYRDSYYNKETVKKNIAEIIVAKGRNVGVGLVEMVYLPQYSKFVNLDRSHYEKKDGAADGKGDSSYQ